MDVDPNRLQSSDNHDSLQHRPEFAVKCSVFSTLVHSLTIHREQITDIHLCNDETLTDGCGEEVRAQYSTVQGGWGVQRRAIRWETVSKYQNINNYRRWLVATGSQVAIIVRSLN